MSRVFLRQSSCWPALPSLAVRDKHSCDKGVLATMSRHKQFLGLAALVGWLSLLLPERAASFSEDATLRQTTDVIALSPFGRKSQPRGESERAAGVPEDGIAPHTLTPAKDSPHFDVAAAHHLARTAPKEYSSPDSFTPSQPVSFSRFSFIPSRPPLGADTYFREDTEELAISPGRQVPRAPPIQRPHQIDSRRPFVHYTDHYEEEEEEGEYVPSYNQRQYFPNDEYESVQYEDDEREPQYDDYHDPYHIGDEYYASPSLPDHRPPHHEEIPHHHQRYPPIDTRPPLHGIRAEEGGGGDGSCKTVNKNGMTCEVCRDEEGSYSEHCSHSTRSDQDETYATGRRHSKRDAAPSTFTKGPSGYIPQIPTEKLRSQVDRIAVQEARSSPSLTTTTADAAKKAHHHGSESDLTTTTTATAIAGPKEAESRQEMSFGVDFDDHDFTFHDDHLFGLDHEPAWYSLTDPHHPMGPRRASLKDTHAQLTEAMDQFMKKDRSSCKKVEKHGMTCYVCQQGARATAEECMYASHQPDGHDLHYSEETTYGSSSSSSSHYPERSSSSSSAVH